MSRIGQRSDRAVFFMEEGTPRYLAHCQKDHGNPKHPKNRHSERSEEPLFEGLQDDQQRSFATLRMTKKGALWII